MHETDEHIGENAEIFPILSKPIWATLDRKLRGFGEIQHRYTMAYAQFLGGSHLRSGNSLLSVVFVYAACGHFLYY